MVRDDGANDNPASVSEHAQRARIADGGFAVALSGGGHRASLATLGALLAIVDRGLAPKVIQVASVSGGSITNAFVAQRCDLESLKPGELDEVAGELAQAIIGKGVLTKRWMAALVLGPALTGTLVGIGLSAWVVAWSWLAAFAGLAFAFAFLGGSGLVVQWLLDRRFFRPGGHQGRSGRPTRFGSSPCRDARSTTSSARLTWFSACPCTRRPSTAA